MALGHEIEQLRQQLQASQVEQVEAQGSLSQLRERIRSGETTGDRIKDFVLVHYGFDEELEQRLRGIDESLRAHHGEFVLVVTREWTPVSSFGPVVPRELVSYILGEGTRIGIIREPFLQLRPELYGTNLVVSTDGYIAGLPSSRRGVKITSGSIGEDILSLSVGLNINKQVGPPPGRRYGLDPKYEGYTDSELASMPMVEIIAGDEAVTKWFHHQAQYERMSRWERDFVESPNSSAEMAQQIRERCFKTEVLESFQIIQATLGHVMPGLPPEIKQKIDEKERREKLKILDNLESLAGEEQVLMYQLERARNITLPRITLGLGDNQYKREVAGDEKDLRRIKSIPVTREIEAVRARIRHQLESAFGLGLHEEEWIIVKEPRPGEKVEINVPQLIRGYAEHYEVPIP